uniref:Synaptogyrin 1 n=1 Tax=Macaca mulatta TaxID=9544 RepID=F6R360_MACMU
MSRQTLGKGGSPGGHLPDQAGGLCSLLQSACPWASGLEGRSHWLCEGAWTFCLFGSFLPVIPSFSKALLNLLVPEGRQRDSEAALILRKPPSHWEVSQVPLGRGHKSQERGLPAVESNFMVKLFSIVVFGSIVNEGYLNSASEGEEFCIYNRNPNACSYGVAVGVLAFLTCLLYLALDVYFPQISSVKDRKKAVLSDIGVSAFWAFLWFVGFCYLANQWQVSKPKDNPLNEGTDAARAAIAFSFFSIFTWSLTAALAVRRFKDLSFQEEYSTLFPASAQP